MSFSRAFSIFMQEAPAHGAAWTQMAQALDQASALTIGAISNVAAIAIRVRFMVKDSRETRTGCKRRLQLLQRFYKVLQGFCKLR